MLADGSGLERKMWKDVVRAVGPQTWQGLAALQLRRPRNTIPGLLLPVNKICPFRTDLCGCILHGTDWRFQDNWSAPCVLADARLQFKTVAANPMPWDAR